MEELVTRRPASPQAWHQLARVLVELGLFSQASIAASRAHDLDPDNARIGGDVWRAQLLAGQVAEAGHSLQKALDRFPCDVKLRARAVHSEHVISREQAYELSCQIAQSQPRFALSWFVHGHALALAGRLGEAIEAYNKGWTLLPGGDGCEYEAPAALRWAACYRRKGAERESLECYARAFDRADSLAVTDPARGLALQGEALEGLSRPRAALSAYRLALESHLTYPRRAFVKSRILALSQVPSPLTRPPHAHPSLCEFHIDRR